MKKLSDYGYSNHIVKLVEPILLKIKSDDKLDFYDSFANFTIYICEQIEQQKLSPKVADDCFTLIDLFIYDNYPNLVLSKIIENILFEGMILHDFGTKYGSTIETLRKLANQLLNR